MAPPVPLRLVDCSQTCDRYACDLLLTGPCITPRCGDPRCCGSTALPTSEPAIVHDTDRKFVRAFDLQMKVSKHVDAGSIRLYVGLIQTLGSTFEPLLLHGCYTGQACITRDGQPGAIQSGGGAFDCVSFLFDWRTAAAMPYQKAPDVNLQPYPPHHEDQRPKARAQLAWEMQRSQTQGLPDWMPPKTTNQTHNSLHKRCSPP